MFRLEIRLPAAISLSNISRRSDFTEETVIKIGTTLLRIKAGVQLAGYDGKRPEVAAVVCLLIVRTAQL